MAVETIAELRARALQIKNETEDGKNDANRVGVTLVNFVDTFENKQKNIIVTAQDYNEGWLIDFPEKEKTTLIVDLFDFPIITIQGRRFYDFWHTNSSVPINSELELWLFRPNVTSGNVGLRFNGVYFNGEDMAVFLGEGDVAVVNLKRFGNKVLLTSKVFNE